MCIYVSVIHTSVSAVWLLSCVSLMLYFHVTTVTLPCDFLARLALDIRKWRGRRATASQSSVAASWHYRAPVSCVCGRVWFAAQRHAITIWMLLLTAAVAVSSASSELMHKQPGAHPPADPSPAVFSLHCCCCCVYVCLRCVSQRPARPALQDYYACIWTDRWPQCRPV